MSTYAELDRQRRKARPLYLELRSLGLDVSAHEDPEDPTGYRVELKGTRSLSPEHAERVRRRVDDLRPGLMRILMMGKWDDDLRAVRGEGGTA